MIATAPNTPVIAPGSSAPVSTPWKIKISPSASRPDRLADERDHRDGMQPARAAGEEVRGAPHQRREERRADHVFAAAAASR